MMLSTRKLALAVAAAAAAVIAPTSAAQAEENPPVAELAPVPDCAGDYASARFDQYSEELNILSFTVDVNNLPFGQAADIYTKVNDGPAVNWQTQEGFASGSRAYSSPGGTASIYISIYSGQYQVCSGRLFVGAPGTEAR